MADFSIGFPYGRCLCIRFPGDQQGPCRDGVFRPRIPRPETTNPRSLRIPVRGVLDFLRLTALFLFDRRGGFPAFPGELPTSAPTRCFPPRSSFPTRRTGAFRFVSGLGLRLVPSHYHVLCLANPSNSSQGVGQVVPHPSSPNALGTRQPSPGPQPSPGRPATTPRPGQESPRTASYVSGIFESKSSRRCRMQWWL